MIACISVVFASIVSVLSKCYFFIVCLMGTVIHIKWVWLYSFYKNKHIVTWIVKLVLNEEEVL